MIPALLVRRYKRFLADVEFADGSKVTAHCPNTGAMTGCIDSGSTVWLSHSENPKRKYAYTLELVETKNGLTCIHSARANKVVMEALENGLIKELSEYRQISSEVRYGQGSRADFVLCREDEASIILEVKAVTFHLGEGLGTFPDAKSVRALKHTVELTNAINSSTRSLIIFCVLHSGINKVSVAKEIDPAYYVALESALRAELEVQAWGVDISTSALTLSRRIPFNL
ncbi:MAG: DNA/RNA nuclease SfsA [Halieaceae bacterium]|nr:DNA/RNA nuclease SfsA [Halieaceae bacterium]